MIRNVYIYTTSEGETGVFVGDPQAAHIFAEDEDATLVLMGTPPLYTLRYETPAGRVERRLDAHGITTVGRVTAAQAARGEVWDVEVIDGGGYDVTFNFLIFV